MLQDLPVELLLGIMEKLEAIDICNLGSTCKNFHRLSLDECLWIKIISKEFSLNVRSDANFSPKHFYKTVLYTYKSTIGLWKQTNSRYYGRLLKITAYCDSLQLQYFETPDDIGGSFKKVDFVKISYQHESNEALSQIQNLQSGSAKVSLTDAGCLTVHLCGSDDDEDSFFYKYEKLEIGLKTRLPIEEGIFLGSYGPHGIEVIQLSLPYFDNLNEAQGIKITGDPNIPAGKVTFRVIDDKCLDMTHEEQSSMSNINEFTRNPKHIEFREDLLLDFVPPIDAFNLNGDEIPFTKCVGRFNCECQIADHDYQNAKFIPGHFIIFNKNYFAVIFNMSNAEFAAGGAIILYRNITKQLLI